MNDGNLISLRELSKAHPKTFPINRLRYLCNRRKHNGFEACLSLIGNKLYVNLEELDAWLDSKKLINQKDK